MKRKAPDTLDSDHRLTKKFHLLNLQPNGTPYTPISASAQLPRTAPKPQPSVSDPEPMQLEDTKDKVYIYDLDAELAELSSSDSDEAPIFIRDVDKQLHQIPKHVLMGPPPEPRNTELVLYKVPESLSVPREQDSVRKAIIEARARARERQGLQVPHLPDAEPYMIDGIHGELANGTTPEGVDTTSSGVAKEDRVHEEDEEEDDPDAMDLG